MTLQVPTTAVRKINKGGHSQGILEYSTSFKAEYLLGHELAFFPVKMQDLLKKGIMLSGRGENVPSGCSHTQK